MLTSTECHALDMYLAGRVKRWCCTFVSLRWAVCAPAQDLDAVLLRVENGTPLDDILSPPQPVASHVVDFSDDEDEGEGEEPDQAAAQPRAPDADVPDMVTGPPLRAKA